MATKPPLSEQVMLNARNARKDARQAFQSDLHRRQQATTILNPDELAGYYDASRLLFTTMGGQVRPITADDLQQFAHNARQLGKKYRGGITPKQVIDLSLADDRQRANEQIRTVMPVSNKAGVVHFQTNAGPDSNVQRHHVYVELLNFNAAVASPKPADKIVRELLKGPVRFDCDCGRHTFWFRYIATIGRYNYGRNETGYPKIRNPKLHGVACKHVLRVMGLLAQSPTFRGYTQRMIEAARFNLEVKRKDTTVKDMKALAEALQGEDWRQRKIRTSDEKRASQGRPKPLADVQAKAATKAKVRAAKSAQSATRALEANAKKLLQLGAINQAQYNAMMQALQHA